MFHKASQEDNLPAGYAEDFPGAHHWPIATQSYDGHQRIWLHTDGQWRTYVDKFTCPYSHVSLRAS